MARSCALPPGRFDELQVALEEAAQRIAYLRIGQRDLSPLDRSIDVRISRLRRKLESDPQNPKIIKTVYGAGYMFSAAVTWS